MPKLDTSSFISAAKIADAVAICQQEVRLPFDILCGVDEVSHSLSSYPARLIDPYIHDDERIYGVGVSRYIKGNNRIVNFTNYNDKDEDRRSCNSDFCSNAQVGEQPAGCRLTCAINYPLPGHQKRR